MMEISRREKQGGIIPDLDIDTYMKVMTSTFLSFNQYCTKGTKSDTIGMNTVPHKSYKRKYL